MYTCRAEDGREQGGWMQGGGWRAWVVSSAKAPAPNETRGEIDRLRAELRGDFRSALRHAYLGPRSDTQGSPSQHSVAHSLQRAFKHQAAVEHFFA